MFLLNLRRFSSSFVFPQRIVRSPTSILEALNSCVQTDGQNPAYQYVDDPFLIPTSAFEKRQFALSKSSGRKAARWIIDRYPGAFFHDVASPSIPSFLPSYSFSEKDFIDVDETTIYKLINWNQLMKAYDIYKKALVEQINVSQACKFALFDLLCINNSENPSEIIAAEEHWYRREPMDATALKKVWKENGAAEQMFEHLKQNASNEEKVRLYNSLVCGLLKFNEAKKAMSIIDEMKENQIRLDLTSYNYLLRSTCSIKESHEARWQFIVDHLKEMKENGVIANLRTFNSVFYALRKNGITENTLSLSLSVLSEMKRLNIEPSLGSWAHLIMIFYPNDQIGSETKILPQILDEVEKQMKNNGNQLEWHDIDDNEFFFNAMFKATVNCRDIDLAKRIHRLLMTGSNIRFITDGYKEQMYYTNFFRLLFRVDIPDHVLPLWESLVPNIFSPSINVIEDFIEFLSLWSLKDYYVRLWSDLLILGVLDNRQNSCRLIERYLALLNRTDQERLNETQIQQYTNVARQIIKRYPLVTEEDQSSTETTNLDQQANENSSDQQGQTPRRQQPIKFQYTGHLLSHLITLLSQGNDLDGSWALFEYYLANRSILINPLTERSLMSLLSLSVKEKDVDRSFSILQTMNDLAYDCLGDALDLVNRSISLTHQDRLQLRAIQKNSSVESAHQVKLI